MSGPIFKEASIDDIPILARIRSQSWGTEEYWINRITGYLNCTSNPGEALDARIIYVAVIDDSIVGLIAGHLTRRLDCQGELEWIDVLKDFQRAGIASALVKTLARWFARHQAYKICIDPGSDMARSFYKKNGAEMLNKHWMYWEDIREWQ